MNRACFRKNELIKSLLLFFLVGLVFVEDAYAHYQNETRHQKAVILIHGLMRTPASLYFLGSYLKKQGYDVYSYDYPSARNSIHEDGLMLHQYIKTFLIEHPGVDVYLITHSLGGIIAREGLAHLSTTELNRISGLIMLAPPNHGSDLAKFSIKLVPFITYFVKPLTELSSEQSAAVHKIPIPKVKIGIIAGRYDAKVSLASARLEGQEEPVLVNSSHTFIMNNAQARRFISNFLEKGAFY
jgi:pimeloyl-ACP methyl ester carboxylesterase